MYVSDAHNLHEAGFHSAVVLNSWFKTAVVKLRCGVFMGFPGKRESKFHQNAINQDKDRMHA